MRSQLFNTIQNRMIVLRVILNSHLISHGNSPQSFVHLEFHRARLRLSCNRNHKLRLIQRENFPDQRACPDNRDA